MRTYETVAIIRQLNDRLRCQGIGGLVVITQGVKALGEIGVANVMRSVMAFGAFTRDNDPHQEHDCATIDVDGRQIIWKIDYYDKNLAHHSPDPTDPSVTERVLTIMLAEDY